MDEFYTLFISFIPKDLEKQNADVMSFCSVMLIWDSIPIDFLFLQKKCFSSLLNDIYIIPK